MVSASHNSTTRASIRTSRGALCQAAFLCAQHPQRREPRREKCGSEIVSKHHLVQARLMDKRFGIKLDERALMTRGVAIRAPTQSADEYSQAFWAWIEMNAVDYERRLCRWLL